MTSMDPTNVTRPIEKISPTVDNAQAKAAGDALDELVARSGTEDHENLNHGIHATAHSIAIPNDHDDKELAEREPKSHRFDFLHKLVPGIEQLANKYHIGNYVMIRGGDEKFFESMPIYARIGMHLLFYGPEQTSLDHHELVQKRLKAQSIAQGVKFDAPVSAKSIPSFVHTYSLQLDELLDPDLKSYKTFNEFFYRKLKDGARPVQNADDPAGICSAADCRLTVYQTVDLAKKFWIKGKKFDIPNLLNVPVDSEKAKQFNGSSLAIFRLAPADYHRFHSPIDAEIGEVEHIPGQYYTVNPQVVNEPGFDVFTANTRSVLYMKHTQTGLPVAFVAIGALLVGSIKFTKGSEKGTTVKRGEELGYFAYGGSTVVAVFPQGIIQFDADLIKNSNVPIETLMKVGYSLGTTPA